MIYSPLRYPGSKRRAMGELLPMFPDDIKDWREPFMGSLSVTLAFIQSTKASKCERFLVGDLNKEIWAFWQGIKDNPQDVYEVQKEWFNRVVPTLPELHNEVEGTDDYTLAFNQVDKEIRVLWKELFTIDCESLDPVRRSARMYLCNKISFSGLGDSGSLGPTQARKFNVEKGLEFMELSKLIQNVEFINAPFTETVKDVTKDTFVFFDPPYYAQEGAGLYGRNGDLHKGFPHKEFGETANNLKCKWMVTYDDSPFVRRLFRGKNIETLYIRYCCSNTHNEDMLDGEELVITNYDTKSEMVTDI
jgi:DNA adenine methylase